MSGSNLSREYERLEARVLALMDEHSLSDTEFNRCALDIHDFQRRQNEPYANFVRHLSAPQSPTDWRSIPAVPLSAFRQLAIRTFPESETVATFHTSGTTGERFGKHHFRSLKLYDRSILRCWDWMELPTLPQIILATSAAQAPHSSLSHMLTLLRMRARNGEQLHCFAEGGPFDWTCLAQKIEHHIRQKTPVLMLGTALAYLHLFEEMRSRGRRWILPTGSAALETGGYKGSKHTLKKPELYTLFAEQFALSSNDLINEYSMTELSSQFYSRGLGNVHRGPPWTRALVINPETENEAADGETGTLKIFDLANLGSVIAIQTRDLAIRRGEHFELIGRDPAALARGCSRAADEDLSRTS